MLHGCAVIILLMPWLQACEPVDVQMVKGHFVQDFPPDDFRGQRLDLVRAKVPRDAPSELCAVQKAQGTLDKGTSILFIHLGKL